MSETRLALVVSSACLVLLVWLVVSRPREPVAMPPAWEGGAVQPPRLDEELRAIQARLEDLRAALAASRATTLESGARRPVAQAPAADLQDELQAIHFAIQSIADAQMDDLAGHQSQNLDEIHRNHPTTNWNACSEVIQQAKAEPGAAERIYFDSDKSAALHGLLMLRPKQVLERFGAPSITQLEQGRFVWVYQSPRVGADGRPEPCLEIRFDKGYVRDVEFSLP